MGYHVVVLRIESSRMRYRYALFLLLTVFASCRKYGCLDPFATNYDSSARVSNNDCIYPPPDDCLAFEDFRDGKRYRTVRIGDKCWMAENLNYKSSDSWCYDDDSANCAKYGRLYRGGRAREVCPEGWHLTTLSEWLELIEQFGEIDSAWSALIPGGISGLDIMPSGQNEWAGPHLPKYFYNDLGKAAFLWTSSDYSTGSFDIPYRVIVSHADTIISIDIAAGVHGCGCRCVRD